MRTSIFLLLVIAMLQSASAFAQAGLQGPHLLIYKTRTDCRHMVPIGLSENRNSIVSYPAPSDVANYKKIEPSRLKKGYLLDNRGVGPYMAFLNISYKNYAKLNAAPSIAELNKMIADRNPLTELWDCGLRAHYDSPRSDANHIIRSGQLKSKCKQLLPEK